MVEAREYILGTHDAELERLRFQHVTWARDAHALWQRAGLRAGDTVLDLGCGPGYTSFELADRVGPGGRVIARDVSERFLAHLEKEARRRALDQIETSLGPAEELALSAASLHGAYSRWLLCWLPDPDSALARVATALRPSGFFALQEYLDWAAMKLLPRSAAMETAVAACMESWARGGGHINVAELVPDLAERRGLRVEYLRPLQYCAPAGSMHWRWLGAFFHSYLPRLIQQRLLSETQVSAFVEDWRRRSESGSGYCCTPVLADIVLRKPPDAG